MAYPPFTPNEGDEPSDATRDAGVRPTDAEQAAADQLDLSGEASLKDALADVVANGTQDEIERLTSRIGAAQGTYIAPNSDASSLPLLAKPVNQGVPGAPREAALLGLGDWSAARKTVAAELADIQSQPVFLKARQQQLGSGTHWHPAQQQDAEPYQPEQEPAQLVETATPESAHLAELPVPEPLVAETLVPESPVPESLVPEPPVPESLVPERLVPEPLVPEPLVPESLVPEALAAEVPEALAAEVPEALAAEVPEALVAEPPAPEPPASELLVSELPLAELAVSELPVPELPLAEPAVPESPKTPPDAPLAGLTMAELTPAEPSLVQPTRPPSLHARLEASLPGSALPDSSHPETPRWQSLSARLEAPLPERALPDPPRPQSQKEATVTPIASALDAATKLAADADAAAAALENLSRMLQAHQRPASMVPSPGQHAALRPMHPAARSAISDSRPMPMPPRSVMPDGDPLQMPTPRPEHRPVQRVMRPVAMEVPLA
ncbi:MAG: hypothetical protein ABWY63_11365, partial [Hyphomicrobiaceae bacterium]